jgi:hypothetical protein
MDFETSKPITKPITKTKTETKTETQWSNSISNLPQTSFKVAIGGYEAQS